MNLEPKLRDCGVEDAELISDLGARTFAEAYSEETTSEDMSRHLGSVFAVDAVAEELAEPESSFFAAEIDGEPAGFVKVNRGDAQTELPNEGGLEIESLYVLERFQGAGVGRLLLDRALAAAEEAGARYVWLGVWERNQSGIRFWKRMGFVEYGSHGFEFAGRKHTDLLMRLSL